MCDKYNSGKKIGATDHHVQWGISDKGWAIKELAIGWIFVKKNLAHPFFSHEVTCSAPARSWDCVDYLHINIIIARCATNIIRIGGIPHLKNGHNHAQWGIDNIINIYYCNYENI